MVTYINVQMTEYLSTNNSLLDRAIVTIVVASILIWGYIYFSESKKKAACTTSLPVKEEGADSELVLSPRITIVFQKDLSDDEELAREIADMYISNRAFYYADKHHRPRIKYFRKNQMMFLSNMKVLIFPL